MSKRNKHRGETIMSNETQENQEQPQALNVEVPNQQPAAEPEQPANSTPTITQEAVVETPESANRAESVAKGVAQNEATRTTARIAQKPAAKSSNIEALKSDNPRVRQLAYQINQYLVRCAQPCTTEAAMVKKLEQFTYIIRAIINSADPAVYNTAYQFFKTHRRDVLSEDSVLQYVHVLPSELSIRVQTIYTVFMELVAANVDKKPFRLDYGLIRDNMKLSAHHPLLNWIRSRLRS